MTLLEQDTQVLADAVARRAAANNDAAWPADLRAARERALRLFTEQGLPGTRSEAWRYTDLRDWGARLAKALGSDTRDRITVPDATPLPELEDAPTIVIANGCLSGEPGGLPAGVTLSRLGDPQGRAACADALMEQLGRGLDPLGALNSALFEDAVLISIADDARIETTLQLVLATSDGVAAQPRILVHLGRGSRARLFLRQVSSGEAFSNALIEFGCGEGASLDLLRLQEEGDRAMARSALTFQLGRSAQLDLTSLDLGGLAIRNELLVRLHEQDARVRINGLQFVDGTRHADNRSCLEHLAPRTTSEETFHGIADGRGKAVFNGLVLVHPGANGTDARLGNRNLLLSPHAEVDTKPELEIYTDDVRCSHGATTGQLDADALFYLASRGIDRDMARRMLVSAFARQVLSTERWPPALVTALGEQLTARLPHGDPS
ncbi:MAG: Fe-S cluster assembly protein SufD [Chromatiales bacterium]|nr:Fe-S cluster assembly protein SufD [Chromatiales bacterium]